MERSTILINGKSTISMAIFNSFLFACQRVTKASAVGPGLTWLSSRHHAFHRCLRFLWRLHRKSMTNLRFLETFPPQKKANLVDNCCPHPGMVTSSCADAPEHAHHEARISNDWPYVFLSSLIFGIFLLPKTAENHSYTVYTVEVFCWSSVPRDLPFSPNRRLSVWILMGLSTSS